MAQNAAQPKTQGRSLFIGGFSTFSVKDVPEAKKFYVETLGLAAKDEMGGLAIEIPDSPALFIYPKEDHKPAVFTVFNLQVDSIETAVEELTSRGIRFLQYDDPVKTDNNGIFWGSKEGPGPNIAWFEDPAGNILSVIEK